MPSAAAITGKLKGKLADRFKAPEWALFFEVANGTGANTRRHADAVQKQARWR